MHVRVYVYMLVSEPAVVHKHVHTWKNTVRLTRARETTYIRVVRSIYSRDRAFRPTLTNATGSIEMA